MRTVEVVISLGSNLGDRLVNLQQAREAIVRLRGVSFVAKSRVYETEPVEVAAQYAATLFLNAILIVNTQIELERLAKHLHGIEEKLGRIRGPERNAPRTLDADIICAENVQLCTTELTVPHPRWSERRFVVEPLAELRPQLVVPGQEQSISEILATLPPRPSVKVFRDEW
ncbi:MAG: 2-amino-4-hydroxy-6-hydroxymethyldihydropteridine diphosphokinase [Kiritimatiellia bacterium]